MSWFASASPDAAIEIAAETVAVAAVGGRGSDPNVQSYALEALPAGAVVPSLSPHNVADRAAVVGALRAALDRANLRPRRVALVIPDTAARVSLVRFDQVPAGETDLELAVRTGEDGQAGGDHGALVHGAGG